FTADLGEGDLDAALLADHAAVLEALVLAAQALVVLDRAEDLGAEEAIPLRLERAVVDRLRLLHLAVRPRADLVGGSEADADRVELFFLGDLLEQIEQCFHLQISWCLVADGGAFPAASPINNARGRCRSRGSGFPSPAR